MDLESKVMQMEGDLKTLSIHVKNSNKKADEQIEALTQELEHLSEENMRLRDENEEFER